MQFTAIVSSTALKYAPFRRAFLKNSIVSCREKSGYLTREVIVIPKITNKALRKDIKRPKPFPWRTKNYSWYHQIYDHTRTRFDGNTKLIVVEGNIASGKTTVAKQIAEEFDMLYVPESNIDDLYINHYGYDYRDYTGDLPYHLKPVDIKLFYEDPNHRGVANFQLEMYRLRFGDYFDILAHIMNTGQGVVTERCLYSDFVFTEAMYKFGYISKNARKAYYELKDQAIRDVLYPHLVVYLDAPASVCLERVKKRNIPWEVSSKVMTLDYLQTIDDVYKQRYLKEMEINSEMLIFDWSQYGDVQNITEEIEQIDFERHEKEEKILEGWRNMELAGAPLYRSERIKYTNEKEFYMMYNDIPLLYCKELYTPSPEDALLIEEARESVPGERAPPGYNEEMGDTVWRRFGFTKNCNIGTVFNRISPLMPELKRKEGSTPASAPAH